MTKYKCCISIWLASRVSLNISAYNLSRFRRNWQFIQQTEYVENKYHMIVPRSKGSPLHIHCLSYVASVSYILFRGSVPRDNLHIPGHTRNTANKLWYLRFHYQGRRWRQQVTPKSWCLSSKLHDVIFYNTPVFSYWISICLHFRMEWLNLTP